MKYAIALALWSLGLTAQQPASPYVQATGEATVTAKPDQARIDIGVITQAANASAASAQNAAQTTSVLEQLRKVVGQSGEIKTSSYSVAPNYSFPKNGARTITGYTASNTVEVTLNDLALVGKIIDSATQSGANNITRLQFTVKDEQPLRAQALREAAAQAKANAEAMASGLGLKVTRALSLEAGQAYAPPRVLPFNNQLGRPPQTPVAAGSIEVHATVTLRVEIGQ